MLTGRGLNTYYECRYDGILIPGSLSCIVFSSQYRDGQWPGQFIKAGPTTFLLINLIAQNRIFNQLNIHKGIFDDIAGLKEGMIINPTTTTDKLFIDRVCQSITPHLHIYNTNTVMIFS